LISVLIQVMPHRVDLRLAHFNTELLIKLSMERVARVFTQLDLTARKFPRPREVNVCEATSHEDTTRLRVAMWRADQAR
jgi:S-adenosylmethionine:tRNA-ribosyltransferase-isomerase (queuine synthetase)